MSILLVVLAGIYLMAAVGYYRTALDYVADVSLPVIIIKPFCAIVSLLWVVVVGAHLISVAVSNE